MKDDIIQFVTNALYRAHDNDMRTLMLIEFDKWVEAQTEALDKYIKDVQPISQPELSRERVIEMCKKYLEPFLEGSGLVIFERSIKLIVSELYSDVGQIKERQSLMNKYGITESDVDSYMKQFPSQPPSQEPQTSAEEISNRELKRLASSPDKAIIEKMEELNKAVERLESELSSLKIKSN